MEVFCVHATFLDFGDNLRCMKQVAGLAGAPRNLPICRVILHKPCNLAGKACSVTGCRPIKKLKNKFFYVSELPTKFVFRFFAWLVVFGNLCLTRWGWGWYTVQAVFGEVSEWFKEPVLKTGDSERGRGFESHSLRQLNIFFIREHMEKYPSGWRGSPGKRIGR